MAPTTNAPLLNSGKSPLVTIGLSVLNGGALLELSVLSVINQTYKNWELLIFDDGSSDGSVERLKRYEDPRIIIICDGENRGLSARLNQAVKMAKGTYFARMDHDDICHYERLARQIAFLETHPEIDLLATKCLTMDEKERLYGELPSAINHVDICRRPWLGFSMPHPSWLGRIDWFKDNLYPEPAPYCCEDQELLLRAHANSRYHTLPEHLLSYRVRSRTPWKKLWRTRLAMLRIQKSYFLSRKEWGGVLLSLFATIARINLDMWREALHKLPSFHYIQKTSNLPSEISVQWHRQIAELKADLRKSNHITEISK